MRPPLCIFEERQCEPQLPLFANMAVFDTGMVVFYDNDGDCLGISDASELMSVGAEA